MWTDRLLALLRYTWPASQQLRGFGLAHAVDSHDMGRGIQSSDRNCDSMTNIMLVKIHAYCSSAIRHTTRFHGGPTIRGHNIGENMIHNEDRQESKTPKRSFNVKEDSGTELPSDLPL